MKILGFITLLLVLMSCGNKELNVVLVDEEKDLGKMVILDDVIEKEEMPKGEENIQNFSEEGEIDKFADWSGEYYTDNGMMLELLGPSDTGGVDIEVSYDDINCVGFGALAYLEKSGVANYYDDASSCQINITYNPGIVEISSYECGEYEDPICGGFSGIYNLK